MELQKTFELLGLKEEHLKVYLANLEWGETIITNIARKSKLPRSTVYLLIKDLLETGLITQTLKGDKTLYTAADPEFLQVLLEKKKIELDNSIININKNMSSLKAIQNANPKKPKVEFLEGKEGIMQAYERTLEAKDIWIQCLTQNYTDVIPEKWMNDYFNKFFGSDTTSREILTEEDEEYVSQYSSKKNQQVRVKPVAETETDLWVYDNKVTFISFNKEKPYALVIEDQGVADAIRNLYDLSWKQAKDLKINK